jgi:predicted nucleic acid-binding protein
MIIVSNTSPLTNLATIGEFELLKLLFDEIHIPEAVWDELHAGGRDWPGRLEVASADWIHRHIITNRLSASALQRDIDQGEAEAIVLATEIHADMILLDEKQGRHAAVRWGLKPLGVIGIILEAKKRGLLEKVRPRMDLLRENAGFWIHEGLFQYALNLAGELEEGPQP